jgi:hypothetical protein
MNITKEPQMNKKFFSSLTIFGVAFALVLAFGAINAAKAVTGSYDGEVAQMIAGNDRAKNTTMVVDKDAGKDWQFREFKTQPYGLLGKSDQ